jgi:hypothetical protein
LFVTSINPDGTRNISAKKTECRPKKCKEGCTSNCSFSAFFMRSIDAALYLRPKACSSTTTRTTLLLDITDLRLEPHEKRRKCRPKLGVLISDPFFLPFFFFFLVLVAPIPRSDSEPCFSCRWAKSNDSPSPVSAFTLFAAAKIGFSAKFSTEIT